MTYFIGGVIVGILLDLFSHKVRERMSIVNYVSDRVNRKQATVIETEDPIDEFIKKANEN